MFEKIHAKINPPVFWGSNLLIFAMMVVVFFFESAFIENIVSIKNFFLGSLGWVYIAASIWLLIILFYIGARFGKIIIGGKSAKPEFSRFAWFSMLFSAGLGTGLLYSGIYEPMYHFLKTPQISSLPEHERFLASLDITFFHWGIPAWVMYCSTALMFSIVGFNLDRGFQFSQLVPEHRKKVHIFINIFAILSILVGVVTTFAIASEQLTAGLKPFLGKVSPQLIIVLITLCATVSVLSGLQKGIRFLSKFNILLAAAIFVYLLFHVDLSFYIWTTVKVFGLHSVQLAKHWGYNSFFSDKDWLNSWTILYWAWWTSWAPFVGLFIARISKGRTIKEFIVGTVLIPSLVSFLWFALFGTAGYLKYLSGALDLNSMLADSPQSMLFEVLSSSAFPELSTVAVLICVTVFYITSSDSGSYVIDMISSKSNNEEPNSYLKIYWSFLEGAVAIALLTFGGIEIIKHLIVLLSLPILIYICYGLYGLISILKKET